MAQTKPPDAKPAPAPAAGQAAAADAKQAKPPAGATAQKPAEAKPAPAAAAPAAPREQTPDMKALSDARALTDLDKRIEALKKVMADFPKTNAAGSAESMIASTLISKTTADIKALQEYGKKFVEVAGTPNEQARRFGQVASSLTGANVLLEEAEQYAKKAMDLQANQKAWTEIEKKAAADAEAEALKKDPAAKPRPAPTDADYASRWLTMRQTSLTTLAQVYEKRGRAADAEKLYQEAYILQPKAAGATALKLAEYAKAANHPFDQLEYLTVATLAGRVTAASRAELEGLYKQLRGGTPAELDEMLDERYEKEAATVDVESYKPSSKRTDRLVVAELFTGAGCPPCVAADLAFEAALERYAAKDVAVLVYHLHIPRPDPMTNPSTQTRKGFYDVPGTPTYFIDGGSQKVGGGAASAAPKLFKDTVESVVDKRLEVKPTAALKLAASMKGGSVDVAVDVKKSDKSGKPDQKLRLQVALVEEMVHYTGENGVRFHPMVVRSLASTEKDTLGFAVTPGAAAKVAYSFDVEKIVADAKKHLDEMEGGASERFGKFKFIERKNAIDAAKLRVIAFVQDEQTKEILQAAMVDLPTPAKPAAGKAN